MVQWRHVKGGKNGSRIIPVGGDVDIKEKGPEGHLNGNQKEKKKEKGEIPGTRGMRARGKLEKQK